MKTTKSNRFSLLLGVSGVFTSGNLVAQTTQIDPGAVPATHTLVKAWEFNTDGDAEGWTGSGLGTLTVAGGVISGGATNNDPQLLNNAFTALPLGYSTILEFSVTINRLGATAGGGTVFWGDYGGSVVGGKSKAINVPEDNLPHVVRITFSGGVKDLNQLRLDPTSVGFPKNVSFDYVRVYHYQPASFTDVTLTASDAVGLTSMNTAGGWDSLAAPTTASNYFTGANQLRTQAGTSYLGFGGSALSVDTGGSLLCKASGGVMVRQLTLAGGQVIQDGTGATTDTAKLYAPDGVTVSAASILDTGAINRSLEITGSLSGSAGLTTKGVVPAISTDKPGQIVLKSDSSGYTGTFTVDANTWLDLDHDNAVAGASVLVNSGGRVRRAGSDGQGTTTAASWTISGRGPTVGSNAGYGAIYINTDNLVGTLAGPISLGATSRIGIFSAKSDLSLDGDISGTGTLELWGGGADISHVQRFILNGASSLDGQTDLLSDSGAQTHLRLGGDDRLTTTKMLRMNATWGTATPEGAGAFFDLNGFDQTLSQIKLDGTKRKYIHDTSASGNSTLTLSAANLAFDTNGGNIYVEGVTIAHSDITATDSGVQIDGGSTVILNSATWNAPFYTSIGNGGSGALVLNNSTLSFAGELLMGRGTSAGTLTIDATSVVTTPGLIRIGGSATGSATVNLNGGTLAARKIHNVSTGTSSLNLDGGILKATATNTVDWIEGGNNGVTTYVLDGGITIDSNGFDVAAMAGLLEDAVSTGGGLTKSGLGTLTLAGDSSYTGATAVQVGNLVVDGDNTLSTGAVIVSANAGLGGDGTLGGNVTAATDSKFAWTVKDWNAAPSLSVPNFTNNGTAADPLVVVIGESSLANFTEVDKTFTILSASGTLASADPAGIVVDASAFTTGSGTWAVQKTGNNLELVYTAGVAVPPYENWLVAYPLITGSNRAPDVDFDNDGIDNGLEFLTGSAPDDSSDAVQPAITRNISGDLVVTFQRADAAEAYAVSVESSTTLQAPWAVISVPNGEITGPPVTVVDNASAPDDVTVIVASGGAPRKFARVKIEIPFTP